MISDAVHVVPKPGVPLHTPDTQVDVFLIVKMNTLARTIAEIDSEMIPWIKFAIYFYTSKKKGKNKKFSPMMALCYPEHVQDTIQHPNDGD